MEPKKHDLSHNSDLDIVAGSIEIDASVMRRKEGVARSIDLAKGTSLQNRLAQIAGNPYSTGHAASAQAIDTSQKNYATSRQQQSTQE